MISESITTPKKVIPVLRIQQRIRIQTLTIDTVSAVVTTVAETVERLRVWKKRKRQITVF